MRLSLLAVLTAVLLLAAPADGFAFQNPEGLNILLTNDDGYRAPGIRVLREALLEAGHRVTVVAPLGNQSGTGMSLTTGGTLDYVLQEEGVWSVDGKPVDAVALGLVYMMRDDPPDLVVSGANFGQNVGADAVHSGTVGAAIMAIRAGYPAIAVSVGVDLRETESATPFSSTLEAYGPAADFVVDLVRQLAETGGAGLLPPRTALNVNYPAVGADPPEGVRFATVSTRRAFRRVYSVNGDSGPARVEVTSADASDAEQGSDVALLAAGYATISVLDGSWDAGRGSWEPLLQRVIIER
jgi:5'-nucleotidase